VWKPGQSGNPSGKPKGAVAHRTRELRDKAKRMGADPLEVMINEIRDLLRAAAGCGDDKEQRRALRTQAVEVAAKLAPYLHPRLANIELTGDPERPVAVEVVEMRDRLLREVTDHGVVIEHDPGRATNGSGNGSAH
jgi:hypothetical protein